MTRKKIKRKRASKDYGDEEDPDEIWDAMEYVEEEYEDEEEEDFDDEEDY